MWIFDDFTSLIRFLRTWFRSVRDAPDRRSKDRPRSLDRSQGRCCDRHLLFFKSKKRWFLLLLAFAGKWWILFTLTQPATQRGEAQVPHTK
ncbi:hypothetical protein QJS10_CPA08g00422 [Acorus calamus]|uniref:Uncharacterized protein n=1 Tax=Acorus calamus TaxID=4465 RepID=A0AAV9EC92_ACOCL|nr:hypothetical protein QJS10_CPA08g00422 [Acorus calamus]